MATLWTWGTLRTNPFVDFSTTWIEPLIQHAVDVTYRIAPDLRYTLAYVAVLGVAYLFHSPFRAHSTAATDTYGRLTKFFQTWSIVVFFCFHLGPQFFRSKQSQIQQTRSESEAVPILYFPLFTCFTVLFSFLHKMKRRWALGLTYGGRPSVIGLNSLILAAVGTVHYAYCSTLYENSTNRLLKAMLYCLTPAPVTLHPFRCTSMLFFLSCCFIAVDYQYKKWHGFDPSRGILWSELYELRKRPCDSTMATAKSAESERRDWRELVAPPRVYAPAALAARSPVRSVVQHGKAGASAFPTLLRAGQPTANASAALTTEATRPIAATDMASFAPSALRPRMLYHECPPDVDMDQVESWFDVDDASLKHLCSSTATSPPLPAPSQPTSFSSKCTSAGSPATPPRLDRLVSTEVRDVGGADRMLTSLMSFRAPRFFIQEVQEAQHPANRPGMVPWWSTFVLFTAWQNVAGATLHFLAFDVRTIQGFATPKIFDLHFSSSLKGCVAAAARRVASVGSAPTRSDAGAGGNASNPLEAPSELETPETSAAAPAEEGDNPDVWFDWIADVGDGFNPTYALARLLAQPTLRLPVASAAKSRKANRGNWTASNMLRVNAAMQSATKSVASAPVSPTRALTGSGSLLLPPFSPVSDDDAEGCETPAERKRRDDTEAAGEGKNAQTLPPPPPPSSPLHVTNKRALGSYERAGSKDDSNDSLSNRESVSAAHEHRGPRRYNSFIDTHDPKIAASRRQLGAEKSGFVTLPRGSFMVIGGDLAYPSPDDETYTTRLFGPYNDALGGNVRLQSAFHAEQQRIVVGDRHDIDVAHLHMLDAESVADIASGRGDLAEGRGTAEEALRSVPLLFAIPGNHDWFDGLTTFRKYILEKTWLGGWLMPQRSSYFVLRLPYNWFMLCCDTGNTQDIDVSQRNYFLDVIEWYMNAESCVIVAAHEPGWLLDAMEREDKPQQPELNRVIEALGTRLRLRLAGDIHNYSRHVPTNPSSEAAMLVVSGGGGAFLHGARNDCVISQGTKYVRACAFPSRTTFTNMASRLWGFRVVNWKFDMVVGFLCFVILLSVLPLPVERGVDGLSSPNVSSDPVPLARVFSLWVAYTTKITSDVVTKGIISVFPVLFFWMCFSSAGSDRHAPLRWRLCYGAVWTFAILMCCSGAMAFIHVQLLYLMDNGFLYSAEGKWNSVMEAQMKVIMSTFVMHARQALAGENHALDSMLGSLQDFISKAKPMRWLLVGLRCCDPFETFSFLSTKVSSGTIGVFADDASRLQIIIYYIYVLFFYWIVITPIASTLIGTFLMVSVTSFDYMYDGTYSAFQIEDYKHFIRFRLDAKTRELHAYVVAVQKPAKVYELDREFLSSLTEAGLEEHRPPHLKRQPSRWAPMQNQRRRKKPMTELLEHFTVYPHRVPSSS
ncbi:hypothetical protein ABL78_5997 [Leptomonas seymouri]|uniref:Calcineurin-like phosphoesterase domain-containing protein n=1 Tax=Leptomonas seymouri TaxID=5684 RepID=A0A0N1PD40_LEPSE|nr:hypothetical protein ABL78_5997 [Leptomonas seymouri]|eukprot:KPI84954.1 hypothetical protein ABL78_5997 [Leptomonas seymouri]